MSNTIPVAAYDLYGDSRMIRGGVEEELRCFEGEATHISRKRAIQIIDGIQELVLDRRAKLVASDFGEINWYALENPIPVQNYWCYHFGDATLYLQMRGHILSPDENDYKVEFRFAASGANHQEIIDTLDSIVESTEN